MQTTGVHIYAGQLSVTRYKCKKSGNYSFWILCSYHQKLHCRYLNCQYMYPLYSFILRDPILYSETVLICVCMSFFVYPIKFLNCTELKFGGEKEWTHNLILRKISKDSLHNKNASKNYPNHAFYPREVMCILFLLSRRSNFFFFKSKTKQFAPAVLNN